MFVKPINAGRAIWVRAKARNTEQIISGPMIGAIIATTSNERAPKNAAVTCPSRPTAIELSRSASELLTLPSPKHMPVVKISNYNRRIE
jgi:hypothetical protein